ncbi:MAG: PAS domain-containing protein, partial [Deltaproteobacteria bacterium]|nr:PAS domain-containing protein [Deltaproteobacteria bacterium]
MPDVELILLRQLASQLAMPIIVVDPRGDLLYFNEAAEAILGR